MSKRSFLRKSAVSLAATMGLGGSVAFADVTLNGGTTTVGTRNVQATGVLTGNYYDPGANPPEGNFASVAGIRALEANYVATAVPLISTDLNVGIDFNQDVQTPQPAPPFFPFATNDTLASIWKGEIVVDPSAAGTYTFISASDDGTVVHIDGNYVVNNNFYQGRTERSGTYNLTAGAHPIVMGWYEGGGGANGTFWMQGGPGSQPRTIINPAAPLPGITFRKVSYTSDPSQQGMNVTVNASSTLEILQEDAIAYNNLTLANGVTFTVSPPLQTNISFNKTTMGATGTLDILANGVVVTGPISSSGPITTLRKTGTGTVDARATAATSNFTSASTVEVSGGTFLARAGTGPGAITPQAPSIGDAKVLINGGTFIGSPSAPFELPGSTGKVGVMFFSQTTGSAAQRMAFLDPIGTGTGLLTQAGKAVDYAGDLRFDDDNPDFGNPNFADVSGGFVGIDNLQVLGYGIGTFTNDPDPFIGDSYGVGAFSDDGAVLWVDKDDNGKFERMNSLGQDELIFNDNSDHGPRVTVQQAQIPAGTHRFAAGFYEAGGNGVMDFRISRGVAPTIAADDAGTPQREDYIDFKAQMKAISPLDSSIITNMKSILQSGKFEMTNPITVSGTNNGLRGDGGVKYTNVTLPNGTAVRVGGAMSLVNPVIDGTATINFDNQIDFGIPQPATPGGSLTLLTGGPADLNLANTTAYTGLTNSVTIGPSSGRLIANGAQTTPAVANSLGTANIAFAGGIFRALGSFAVADTLGAPNTLTEYFYNTGTSPALLDPLHSPASLLGRTATSTLSLTGPISGINDAAAQTRWGDQDTLAAMWYGDMTFTTDPSTGNVYTFASNSDDGSVWWIDLNDDGKFEGAAERVVNNNGDHGPVAVTNSGVTVNPGTHKVALAAYENGGGMIFEFKFARGNVPFANTNFVDPTQTSVASFRARTYAPQDVATPSFTANAVTVTGNTTVESQGASAFGPMTFQNTAEVNLTQFGSTIASATVNSGTGTIRNSAGNGRVSVGDAGASAGATLQFTGSDSKVTGALTGAGTVKVDQGILSFSKNGTAATGSPKLDVNLGATMDFNPGAAGTFAAAPVSAVNLLGTLKASAGVTDLSGATITTPSQVGGLLQGRVAGAFNITDPNPGNFGLVLEPIRAQVPGSGNVEPFPDNTTYIYSGQMFFPDNGAADGMSEFAFAECFDDSVQVKIDGVERLNNGVWNVANTTGALSVTSGWHDVEFRFGEGGGGWGPSGQDGWVQNPPAGIAPGFGVDFTVPIDPGTPEAVPVIKPVQANFQRPIDPGNATVFRTSPPPGTGQVQVLTGATLKIGSVVNAGAVSIAPNSTLQLNGAGTSKVEASALTIPGSPGASTGTLDVNNSAIVLDYPTTGPTAGEVADVRARIIEGRGGQGLNKTWNGKGITSTAAGAAPINSMSVGYAVNGTLPLTVYSNFRGQPVDPSSILIRFTRTADANLDGVVNNDDVAVVGANYAPGSPKPRWDLGDFDYNGFVDNDDITLLGAFYNPSAPPIPAPAAGVAAVPEPASWLMLTIGGLGAGLAGWRRRRGKK